MPMKIIEPPVSTSGWTMHDHTRDACIIRDAHGRKVAIAYRVGDHREEGGSAPREVAAIILQCINKSGNPESEEREVNEEKSRIRAMLEARQIPHDGRLGIEKLREILEKSTGGRAE